MSVARLAPGLFLATAAIAWLAAVCAGGSDRPTLDAVQQTLDADAAKGRFTGPLGDFIVVSQTHNIPYDSIACRSVENEFVSDPAELGQSELWDDALGAAAAGVSCGGRIVVINSGPDPLPDGTQSLVRMYFDALPASVALDAPRDRIELTKIEGYSAIIEHPLEGLPYSSASLAVIDRYPSQDQPGIVAYVNFSPSEDIAVSLAKRLLQ